MSRQALLILKLGVAFVFLYAATASLLDPTLFINYFPYFMRNVIPDRALVTLYSLFEIFLSGWLLFGKNIFIPALILSLLLVGIGTVNWQAFSVLFRNVAILGATLALAIENRKKLT